jgi:hypothetical protein
MLVIAHDNDLLYCSALLVVLGGYGMISPLRVQKLHRKTTIGEALRKPVSYVWIILGIFGAAVWFITNHSDWFLGYLPDLP